MVSLTPLDGAYCNALLFAPWTVQFSSVTSLTLKILSRLKSFAILRPWYI